MFPTGGSGRRAVSSRSPVPSASTNGGPTRPRLLAHACLTVSAAVTKAASGDTINVGAGTFNEQVTVPSTKTLTFNGAGSDASTGTIVDGHGAGTPFTLTNGGTLNNMRVTEDSAGTVLAGSTGSSHSLAITNAVIIADGYQSPLDAETSGGSLSVSITDSTLQQVQTDAAGSEYGVLLQGQISASLVRSTVSSVRSAAVAAGTGVNVTATDSTLTGETGRQRPPVGRKVNGHHARPAERLQFVAVGPGQVPQVEPPGPVADGRPLAVRRHGELGVPGRGRMEPARLVGR